MNARTPVLDHVQSRLLNEWQRDLPLVSRPFHVIADALGVGVERVLKQLSAFCVDGTVSRVGPVFRPNSIGVSTLVAVAVPPTELEVVAALINNFDEVNHNYEREHVFNLWFVATSSGQRELKHALDCMEIKVGYTLLRLPLVKDYHIDLGFDLNGCKGSKCKTVEAGKTDNIPSTVCVAAGRAVNLTISSRLSPQAMDALLCCIQSGLPLVERPYQAVAQSVGCTEVQVLNALSELSIAGTIKRLGVVVRHQELGYLANAMVVWDVPDAQVDALGRRMGAESEVTLCYRRPRVQACWPYNLFCMIHGQDRDTVLQQVRAMAERLGLQSIPHQVLFSGRRFKQRGARYRRKASVAALRFESAGVASHG